MFRNLLLGAGLAAALGFAAHSQTMPAPDQSDAQSPAGQPSADASAPQSGSDTAAVAKPGMVVKDSAGATLGKVVQVGQTADGQSAVVVEVDGAPITLA